MEEIFLKARSGDELAFEELVNSLKPNLYKIAYIKLNNSNAVNDVLQDTFISLYVNIKKIKSPDRVLFWITKVLLNNCKKYWKNNKKELSYDELEAEKYISNTNDYEKIESNHDIELILKTLTDEEKNIIILYYIGEYTSKDIAKLLHINESTVRSKIKRSIEKIRKGENYGR